MSEEVTSKASGYYAKVLGTFWRHPRTSTLSLAARGLWVSLLSWCADQRSDGVVPTHVLVMVAAGQPTSKPMAELEAGGLVVRSGSGYAIRDWAQHNITRERHDAYNAKKSAAMANVRATRKGRSAAVTTPVTGNRPATEREPSEQEQEHEQEQSRPSGRDVTRAPESPVQIPMPQQDPIESALRVGYARRYQRESGDAWMTHSRDNGDVRRAALWCRAQPRPLEAAERLLDGAFGSGAPASWRKSRWPWKWLAEDPARTASLSTIPVGAMGDHESLDEAAAAAMAAIPTMDLSPREGETW